MSRSVIDGLSGAAKQAFAKGLTFFLLLCNEFTENVSLVGVLDLGCVVGSYKKEKKEASIGVKRDKMRHADSKFS